MSVPEKNPGYITRQVERQVRRGLSLFPVVVLEGARQVGKTTTVKRICRKLGGTYMTMDDVDTLYEAETSPKELLSVAKNGRLVVIDVIQRMPSLILEVKRVVDNDGRPGMFLLTGSGDRYHMLVERKPLAGRCMSIVMRPMSTVEIESRNEDRTSIHGDGVDSGAGVVEAMVAGAPPPASKSVRLADAVSLGGYPKCVLEPESKAVWINRFFQADLQASMRQATRSQSVVALPVFLSHVASRIGKQANLLKIAGEMGQSHHNTRVLHDLVGNAFVIEPLPGERRKFRKRNVQVRPKLYLNDTGLATTLLGLDGTSLPESQHWGALVENFVLAELRKSLEISRLDAFSLSYFAESGGIDFDILLNCGPRDGLIPIEVKAATKVRSQDIRNILEFKKMVGDKCKRGYLLYDGDEVVEMTGGIQAWPISCLWAA